MTPTERRLAVRIPFWGWALLVGVVTRAYGALLVELARGSQVPVSWTGDPVTYGGMTMLWDGTWYRRIAEGGYPAVLPVVDGRLQQNEWAFYPLFPMLSRAVMRLTGLPFSAVGGSLAVVLAVAATVLVALVLRRMMHPLAALAATAVWACYLASPVMNLAYTEPLAVLLLAGFLLLVEDRRWWGAAAVALLVGLARPIALPLGAVALAAVAHRLLRGGRPQAREALGMGAAVVACGVAGLTWPLVAWWRTGVRSAYTDTMATWRSGPIVPFRPWYDNSRFFFGDAGPLLLAGAVVLYLVVVLGPWARGLTWATRAWVLAYPLYLGAVLDPISSTLRYLIPLFPVAGVLVGLGPRRRAWQLPVAVGLVVVGCALQAWWVRTFVVFHPPSSWPP